MQPRKVKDANGNEIYVVQAEDEFGNKTWKQVQLSARGKELASRPRKGPAKPQVVGDLQLQQQELASLNRRGDLAKQRAKEAAEMPFINKAMISAGRETDKLLTGAADIKDFLFDVILQDETAAGRTYDRQKEQQWRDEMYKELSDRQGLGDVGAMLPYIATGRIFDKAGTKVADSLINVGSKVGTGIKQASGAAGDVIEEAATRPNLLGRVASQAKDEVVTPIRTQSQNMAARPNLSTTYRESPVRDLLKSAAIGGAEGGLHYDETVGGGLLSSLIGSSAGMLAEPRLSKAKNLNSKNANDVLDWAESKGYRVTPGLRTGQPKYQRFESDTRTDDRFSGYMKQYDDTNREVQNRIAGDAMGLEGTDLRQMTPETLGAHMGNLKTQYQDLEAGTVGRIEKPEMIQFAKRIADLPKKEQAAAKEQLNKFVGLKQTTGRDQRGRFTKATFDGSEYQKLRSGFKEAADTAYNKGNMASYNFFKDMVKSLDDGMERGVREFGGESTSRQWKDLNEQYALTKLVMEHGMNELGQLDLNKLSNYFMSHDPERLLLGKGGRVKELHNLAKLNRLERDQAGGGLNRLNVEAGEEVDKQTFSSTPNSLTIPLSSRVKANLYYGENPLNYSPATHGLLGMDPRNPLWNAADLSRASQQGSDIYTDTGESLLEIVEKPIETLNSVGRRVGSLLYDLFN